MQKISYSQRYSRLAEQHAYERRAAAFGLKALLAPYSARRPVVAQVRVGRRAAA